MDEDYPEINRDLSEQLKDLRRSAENMGSLPSISFRDGVYRVLGDKNVVWSTVIDGIDYGYKLFDLGGNSFCRRLFVKADQPLNEIYDDELDVLLASIFDGAFDMGAKLPEIYDSSNTPVISQAGDLIPGLPPRTLVIEQLFHIAYLVERNPNLVKIAG